MIAVPNNLVCLSMRGIEERDFRFLLGISGDVLSTFGSVIAVVINLAVPLTSSASKY